MACLYGQTLLSMLVFLEFRAQGKECYGAHGIDTTTVGDAPRSGRRFGGTSWQIGDSSCFVVPNRKPAKSYDPYERNSRGIIPCDVIKRTRDADMGLEGKISLPRVLFPTD